jgi:cation diffusion facilitator CzcD-associated flavoprotein CzcO
LATTRPPDAAKLDYDAIIIGAGMSGLYQLYRLREQGMRVRVFEAGTGVGGTWYWNRYPGARFDSESYSYGFSFSKELLEEWNWSEHFAPQPETLRYLNTVADKFDLRRDIQFRARVASAHWDEAARHWAVTLEDGTRHVSRFLITAIGVLSAPTLPRFEGMDSFRGLSFHTARWPHEPVDFAGKRVAVIGTGASAYQIVPAIVDQVSALTVFQRSSPWMLPTQGYYADMPDSVQWLVGKLPHYGQWLRFWQHWLGIEGRQHTTVAEPGWDKPGSVSAINAKWR